MAENGPRDGSPGRGDEAEEEFDAWEAAEEALEAERRKDPAYVREKVRDLAREAAGGSAVAVDLLLGWLDLYPETRPLVRALDDLVAKTERAWVDRLAGADPLSRRAVGDELAALKAELLGPAPSALDKVLAGTVLVAHMDFQRAARAAAQPASTPEVMAARGKLLAAAQKRLHDAVRGWRLYAGAKARGARPAGGVRLFGPAPA